MRLHTTVGPAETSIAGVAEEADVTRLTIYRHFPEIESLFAACRAHWRALNPAPDTDAWSAIPNLEQRAGVALGQLYQWFGDHGDELFPIYRDAGTMPLPAQEALRAEAARIAGVLIEGQTQTLPLYVQDRYDSFDTVGAYSTSVLLAMLAMATVLAMTFFKPKEGST